MPLDRVVPPCHATFTWLATIHRRAADDLRRARAPTRERWATPRSGYEHVRTIRLGDIAVHSDRLRQPSAPV